MRDRHPANLADIKMGPARVAIIPPEEMAETANCEVADDVEFYAFDLVTAPLARDTALGMGMVRESLCLSLETARDTSSVASRCEDIQVCRAMIYAGQGQRT